MLESKDYLHSIKLWVEWLGALKHPILMLMLICCSMKIYRLDKRCKFIEENFCFFQHWQRKLLSKRFNRKNRYGTTENAMSMFDWTAPDPRLRFHKNFPSYPVARQTIGNSSLFMGKSNSNFIYHIRWKIVQNERKNWNDLRPVNFRIIFNLNVMSNLGICMPIRRNLSSKF